MIINKVINNNVLSTHDENNREIVLMGKGIGFQKKVGDEVAEDKIEKRFVLDCFFKAPLKPPPRACSSNQRRASTAFSSPAAFSTA